MKTNLQTSKSILAKLLASENITVTHQTVRTAYFDLKSRTMTLPVWKEMDGDLYDLLTGHEVGHALNTPEQGWHDQVASSSKKYKDFLNVIEDARIEKLVKRKFPGLSKSFAKAYAGLYERDFFGTKKLGDLSKLNLIDRINLRFKLGAHVVVEFNDFERDIVREVENAETWDQVVDIAQRVYEYVKENEQDKIQNQQELQEEKQNQQDSEQDSDDQYDYDDSDDDSDDDAEDEEDIDSPDEESEDSGDSEWQDSEDSNDEQEESGTGSVNQGGQEDDDEPQSVTDRNFRQRENELVNKSGKVLMYNLPDANLENIILPNTEVMNDLEQFIQRQVKNPFGTYGTHKISYETVLQKCVRRFNTANKKTIMHILKEFEMRKKASEYARTQTARTGELNMNVLHKYKFSNDLFKKITVVPKGKNHGFVLFVDMSGSMYGIMRNTIDQLLILVSFCKLAKIPCEVYGFSNDYYSNAKLNEMTRNKWNADPKTEMYFSGDSNYHLKHLIGTSLSPIQYRKSFNILCVVANEYYRGIDYTDRDNDHGSFHYNWQDGGFGLNGTPFHQTLLASRDIIRKFQAAHMLDVCNVVYLTDGEGGSDLCYPHSDDNNDFLYRNDAVVYFIDKKTKKKIKVENRHNIQSALTELVADVTGCKHIGFYIGSRKDISRELKHQSYYLDSIQSKEMSSSLRQNNFFISKNRGYSKYFFVGLQNGNVKDQKLQIDDSMSKSKMVRAFSNNLTSKRTNRLLLTKLAEELAVA